MSEIAAELNEKVLKIGSVDWEHINEFPDSLDMATRQVKSAVKKESHLHRNIGRIKWYMKEYSKFVRQTGNLGSKIQLKLQFLLSRKLNVCP